MKPLLAWLFLICLPAFGQDMKPYAGTWEASFKGKTFLTLTLASEGNKLTGNVIHDNFNVDQDGNLTEIEPRDAHEKVTIVRPAGKGIDLYTHDDTEPSESGHYHLELTNDNEGQLTLVILEPGGPAVKPWTVNRKAQN